MAALMETTVIVTTRQSDSVPNASEVAMAPRSLGDATGARLPSKPIVPDNRIMVHFPVEAGRITRRHENFAIITGNIAAVRTAKMA